MAWHGIGKRQQRNKRETIAKRHGGKKESEKKSVISKKIA